MDSTAYLVLSWIALAFMGLMLLLALFEPSLPYRMSKRPPLPAELRPAPMPGEHTREICQRVLAMDVDEIDRLISQGVLFTHQGSRP